MNPIVYQLYLLQIENYEIGRFWKLLFTRGYFKPNAPLRKSIVWTTKARLIMTLSVIIALIFATLMINSLIPPYASLLVGLFTTGLVILLFPVYYTISLILLLPFDFIAKKYYINKARKIISATKDLKIIGIAGSYGKTTMKNVLLSILQEKYKIVTPEGNINTALGISTWVTKKSLKNTDILLVEFGEEYEGDNAKIAKIFPPDMVIITGVNEAHFERFGNIERLGKTIFESVINAKKNAKIYLNSDDQNVMKMYDKYLEGREKELFSQTDAKISDKTFDMEKLVWSAKVKDLGSIEVPFLAKYIFADLSAVISISKELGLTSQEVKKGIANLKPVKHRLEPIKGEGGVLVIDDSYNGNPAGVNEAIKTLALFKNRRKVYLTPGLVETGLENSRVHTEIGKELAKVADVVILVKNSATPYIENGLLEAGFKKENILWFETAFEAHNSLSQILQKGDVILFQNDWGDQYV